MEGNTDLLKKSYSIVSEGSLEGTRYYSSRMLAIQNLYHDIVNI